MQLHALEPLFKIFLYKKKKKFLFFPTKISPGKIADKYIENLKQAAEKI